MAPLCARGRVSPGKYIAEARRRAEAGEPERQMRACSYASMDMGCAGRKSRPGLCNDACGRWISGPAWGRRG